MAMDTGVDHSERLWPGKPPRVPPLIQRAQDAFRRDLTRLLQTHFRQWVAYHGDELVGFAASQFELYAECRRRGYLENEFLVQCIVAEPEEIDPSEFADR